MDKDGIKKIWQGVQENSKRLEQCSAPHDFVQNDNAFLPKWKCMKCGGVINNNDHYWYAKGLEHARIVLET